LSKKLFNKIVIIKEDIDIKAIEKKIANTI